MRLAAFEADGVLALGAHIMEGAVGFVEHRRMLARGDAYHDAVLMDFQHETLTQVRAIQRNAARPGWGF